MTGTGKYSLEVKQLENEADTSLNPVPR